MKRPWSAPWLTIWVLLSSFSNSIRPPLLLAIGIDVPAPSIISGIVNVTWLPSSGNVDSYIVTASPLDGDDDLDAALQLPSSWHQSIGIPPSSITSASGALTMSTHGGHDVLIEGRGSAPYVVRKIPIGAAVGASFDCSNILSVHSSSACGLIVFDAGSNSALFTVVLRQSGGSTVMEAFCPGHTSIARADVQTGGTSWTAANGGVSIRIARGPAGVNRTWTARVLPLNGPGSGIIDTNLTFRESAFEAASWAEADLWFGMTAYGWGGSASTQGTARMTSFHISMPIPAVAPATLWGSSDVCVAPGRLKAVSVSVPGTDTTAVISGLSGYFPYTITVIAVESGTGLPSPPSKPIPGLYFYPRPMPPRHSAMGAWYDSKNAPGGVLAKWPDAAMRGHDLNQANVGLRPSSTGGNWYNPASVRFARTKGTVMATGADQLDLGIGSDFTVYVMARGVESKPQVVMGRGGPAGTITGTKIPGWSVFVYNELFNPYPGFLALKADDANTPNGGAAVRHGWWIPNTAVNFWYVNQPPMYVFTGTGSSVDGSVTYAGWKDDNGVFETGLADALGNTTTGWPIVAWNGSVPLNGGASSTDLAFRVGAMYTGGAPDTLRAFEGDIYQIAIYREAHDAAMQKTVRSWLQNYYSGQQCSQNIGTPVGVTNTGICSSKLGGIGQLRCHQYCSGGNYQYYLGTWGDHWCQNGAWTGAPLICRKGCGTALPPLYAKNCYRNIMIEDFNQPDSYLRYTSYPVLPWAQQDKVWRLIDAPWAGGRVLIGNTSIGDACARELVRPNTYAIHPTHWNDWYLPWGTRAYVSLTLTVSTNISIAGLALRFNNEATMYRAVLFAGPGGARLERVTGGKATIVGKAPLNFSVAVGEWIPMEATYNQKSFTISSNNVTLIEVTDYGGPNTGSLGFYLDGQGAFGNMSVNSTCDAFMVGRNMVEGMSVSYKCRDGYTPLGNETWTCAADGTYKGTSLICRSRPPVFGNYSFSVFERSPNGTLVGVATAWPAGPDQTVTYELMAQYPRPGNTSGPTFIVVPCSGAIRVADPYALDFQEVQSFNLTIKAVPDAQEISAAYTNVTIVVLNVVDPPQLIQTQLYINESQWGAVDGPMQVYNPDKYTLQFSIGAGDVNSVFTIDKDTGLVYVKAPGLAFVNADMYDLLISAETLEDPNLVTNGIGTVNVIDVNTPPVLSDETFFIPEGLCTADTFLGLVSFQEVDLQPTWNNATTYITRNADKGATLGIFRMSPYSGSLFFDKTLTYSAGDTIYWFGDNKARDVFTVGIAACDNGALCTPATVTVVILVMGNVTTLTSIITGITWPSTTGMITSGGDVVRFTGVDFPLSGGMLVTADYGSTALGVTFRATSCFIKSETVLQCSAAEGYGAGLTWRVFINAQQVPSSVALITSYAPPTVLTVDVTSAGLTTAGSALAAVTITGENFGGAPIAVRVRYGLGPSGSYTFTVPTINSVSHTVIRATLGAGCGSDLDVEVTVGGQASSTLNPTASRISYPVPSITMLTPPGGYTLMSLPTVDPVDVILTGTNLGPATWPSSMPLTVTATYQNAGAGLPSVYSYSMTCRKDDILAAHTRLVCPLAKGVSTGFTWTLDVCGQQSAPGAEQTGYAPPVLNRVSGPGSLRANTEGGQSLTLDGVNLGPVCCDGSNPPSIQAVQYGTPGLWQHAAQACAVTSTAPPQMQCLTGSGTGRGHSWRLNIGGQWSQVLDANTSYSPPILYNFQGAVDDAVTAGGGNVTVLGSNFGDSLSKISVTYIDRVTDVSKFTGLLPQDKDGGWEPGSPVGEPLQPGHLVYTPPWCVLTRAHKELTCGLQPGGGTGISWVIVVDSQISTAPTTAYGAPRVDAITLARGGSIATSDGGDVLTLRGVNFGEPHLIQSITYGPSGREYAVAGNFTWVSHYHLTVVLAASIPMGPMSFMMTVADQPSQSSSALFTIAAPVIISVSPSDGDTETDPDRPTLIRVSGIEFGLLDMTAEVALAFGNAADRTLLPLIQPSGRIPSLLDVTSPAQSGWVRPAYPIQQTFVFALPSGLGKERAVRVLSYRRGKPPTLGQVALMATQGPAALFSYRDPFVDYIVVLSTTQEERDAVVVALGGLPALNGSDPNAIVLLELNGRYFGPPQDANKDGVTRIIEENLGGGVTSQLPFVIGNWSHRVIQVYSLRPSGNVRVRIVSQSVDGLRALTQTSGWSSFSDVSPAVSGIVGLDTGFATIGGQSITLKATGLGNALTVNITVGGRRCALLDGPLPTGGAVEESNARAAVIVPQGLPPGTVEWTLHCMLPEGQGVSPVVLIRDGVRSSAIVHITYAPPTVSKVGTRDADSWPSPLPPFVMRTWTAGVPVTAPTTSSGQRTIRLEGINMGVCPSLRFDILPPVRVDACLESIEAGTGRPILVPNPVVSRDHTFLEFEAPDGVGTGIDALPPIGWTLTLSAGGRDASNGALLYRHMAPIVQSIAPGTGSTKGGSTLTIVARQLGPGNMVPQLALGSARRSYMPCANPVRVDARTCTCKQPEGSGILLNARVTVSDLSGFGGVFNYTPPTITSIGLASIMSAVTDPGTNGTVYTFSTPTSTFRPSAAEPIPPFLRLPAVCPTTTVLVLSGDSFGPPEPDNCMFAAWADRTTLTWTAGVGTPPTDGPLLCQGETEDFLGEGQVPGRDVLEWGHDRIVIRAPRGTGRRVLTLRAGGQAPDQNEEYPSLLFNAPLITGSAIGLTELSTNGGGRARIPALDIPRPPFGGTVFGDAADMSGRVDGSIDTGILQMPSIASSIWNPNDPNGTTGLPVLGSGVPYLSFPYSLPLERGFQAPTEHVVVSLGTRCLSSAVDIQGSVPAWLAAKRCIHDSVLVQSREGIVFAVPPGVGANKSVTIAVHSAAGAVVFKATGGLFTYDPPAISRVEPSPVYVRLAYVAAGSGLAGQADAARSSSLASQYVLVSGKNFGRLSDSGDWTDEEKSVSVAVAGSACAQPERIVRLGSDVLQCRLDGAVVPVGRHNVSVVVGGQEGGVPGDERGLFVVCSAGLYAFVGDVCLSCPQGADCPGFLPDEGAVRESRVNVSAGPVRRGRVQYDVGGMHMGPIPLPGFYNLNHSDSECPPMMLVPGRSSRDVCIVACMDRGACLGDNVCGEAYQSTPPLYRCSTCAKGYYRRAGDCEKCPDSPAAQFLLLLLVAVVAAMAAASLNRYKINPGAISIGLDFFQVVAIFANSKVQWPAVVKELFYILSAFNLNLELLAPECFIPEVTFANKFGAIMSMPVAVYVLFFIVHGVRVWYKKVYKGQTDWGKINAHLPGMISASLLLLYILYLYVTKTILDVFNCVPTEPPDGKLYLQAVFEECGKPGGAQMTLLPYGILCCVVYVVGYPLAIANVIWSNHELILQDQLLRAKGVGDDRMSNPHAYDLRRTVSRVYYLFKPVPDRTYWVLVILVRKFLIAFVTLIFARNVGFQMAAALLVLFLSYAAQVRYQPYMSPDETMQVIRDLLAKSVSSPLHNRLRATLATVEQSGRKRVHGNSLLVAGGMTSSRMFRSVVGVLMNYNFVDATLLFACCLVNLSGLLFEAANPADTYYASSRDGVTACVMFVIAASTAFWFAVMITDISVQVGHVVETNTSKSAQSARAIAARKLGRKLGSSTPFGSSDDGHGQSFRLPTNVFSAGMSSVGGRGTEVTMTNPMFTKNGKNGDTQVAALSDAQMASTVESLLQPPDLTLWNIIRESYMAQTLAVNALGTQLSAAKADVARMKEAVDMVGLAGIVLDPREAARNARPADFNRPSNKRGYDQSKAAVSALESPREDKAEFSPLGMGIMGEDNGTGIGGARARSTSLRLFGFQIGSDGHSRDDDVENAPADRSVSGIGAARGAVGSIRTMFGLGGSGLASSEASAPSSSPKSLAGVGAGSMRNLFGVRGAGEVKVSMASLKAATSEANDSIILSGNPIGNPIGNGQGSARAPTRAQGGANDKGVSGAAPVDSGAAPIDSGAAAAGENPLRRPGGRLLGRVVKAKPDESSSGSATKTYNPASALSGIQSKYKEALERD